MNVCERCGVLIVGPETQNSWVWYTLTGVLMTTLSVVLLILAILFGMSQVTLIFLVIIAISVGGATFVSIKQSDVVAWYNKGVFLQYNLDNYDNAIEAFDKAIMIYRRYFANTGTRIWPTLLIDILNSKGVALQRLNRNAEAETVFAKAKELGYKG